jgi:uncharacterized protein (TIGR02118 family)
MRCEYVVESMEGFAVHKILGFWSHPAPDDIEAFERRYLDVHCPKACLLPRLRQCILTQLTKGPDGTPGSAPYYRLAELVFDSEADLNAALASPEAQRMSEDSEEIKRRFGVTVTIIGVGVQQVLGPAL